MGMGGGSKPGSVKNDINVTPMVDIVLVLLIIFMVITPMLQSGKDVTLPKATKQEKADNKKGPDPLILSVTPDKQIYVEQDAYDETNLETRLATEFGKDPGRKILLKGDTTLTFADVRKVMQIAKRAGAKGIALGVEEEK
ncbi:MAG: biopolymer transporter ExbD [Myxococcota bacterium]|nr:biopolymer transporter ExbD [Myxococcota bacterium]